MPPKSGNTIQFLQSFLHSYSQWCNDYIEHIAENLKEEDAFGNNNVCTEILYSSYTNINLRANWLGAYLSQFFSLALIASQILSRYDFVSFCSKHQSIYFQANPYKELYVVYRMD